MTYENISTITKEAKQRLKWMEHLRKYRNARLTCRHFGISPTTLYLWKKRFDPNNLKTLEDEWRNRRPKVLRKPAYTMEVIEEVKKIKQSNPRVGRILITKMLRDKGIKLSTATVGRILALIAGDASGRAPDSAQALFRRNTSRAFESGGKERQDPRRNEG